MENAQQIEETKVVPAPESAQKGSEAEKTYTEADILQLKSAWETEAKANAEKADEEKRKEAEFAKLPENEKIIERAKAAEAEAASLREQLKQKELNEYAITQLTANALSADALSFIHGKDSKAIDLEVAALEKFITAQAQKRVDDRIKGSQHVPFSNIGTASTNIPRSVRGVQRID